MSPVCLSIIHNEHRALSAMLRSITLLLEDSRRRGRLPDFGALRAMLFYVDEFPEKLHHPKETLLLFPKLRGRDAHLDAVLDRLDHDHEHGRQLIRELEHLLLAFEVLGDVGADTSQRDAFEDAVRRYVGFYLKHMRIEETEILPLARATLGADDWIELDAAFLANRDALAGARPDAAYRPLFEKILHLLEPTASIASALEAFAGVGPPSGGGRR